MFDTRSKHAFPAVKRFKYNYNKLVFFDFGTVRKMSRSGVYRK